EAAGIARQINEAIQEARQRARKAAKMPASAQAAGYEEALDACADLPEAVEGLARCPPEAPAALEATFIPGSGVVLHWEPVRSARVTGYRVLRRKRVTDADECLAEGEVPETTWTDRAIKPGGTYWYAVQSVASGGAISAAVACDPILVVAEVAQLEAEAGD